MSQDKQHVYIPNRDALRAWLLKNHATHEAVWLVYDKGNRRTMSYDDIVEEVLCFGWVDSLPGKVDEARTKLYISPRKPRSAWSKLNRDRVAKLDAAGLLHDSGRRAIEVAKQNGAWDALIKSDSLELPPQLDLLLEQSPQAKAHFEAFPPSSRRAILEWIYAAKREETRRRRIEETARLAADNIRANHYRQ